MEFNIENMNFNEWGPSFEFDAGFSASFDLQIEGSASGFR